MKTENRQATCHIRIYDKDGLVLSTNPTMDANYLAHILLDVIAKHADRDPEIEQMQEDELDRLERCN